MNGGFMDAAITIGGLIIGVASLSVILSPKSKTAEVVQSVASGFSNSLATAMSPVTGAKTSINLSYPNSGGLGAINLPTFN